MDGPLGTDPNAAVSSSALDEEVESWFVGLERSRLWLESLLS